MTTATSRTQLREDLVAILRKHAAEGVTITASSTLSGDLALDSLTVLEAFAEVEDLFQVVIPDEDLADIRTVDDVAVVLEARLAEKGVLA